MSKLWHQGTGGTVELCRAHGRALQDADEKWVSAVVVEAIRERDAAVDSTRYALRMVAQNFADSRCTSEELYEAARRMVVAENARKEILR